MIWHIFKKDVQLLWPLALAVVGLQALCAALTSLMGYFNEPAPLAAIARHLPDGVFIGVVLLGVVAVHQEPLETLRADWLVRPIRRTDILLSKALFMILMVNLPLMLIDVSQQLALHFPLGSSMGVAAIRSLNLMVFVSLPGLVLGAVTRSLMDAFAVAVVGFVTFGCLFALILLFLNLGRMASLGGQTWINGACGGVILAVGAAATLALQYVTRRTAIVRIIGLGAMVTALLVMVLLPRDSALTIQKWLWGRSPDNDITLRFSPDTQRARTIPAIINSPFGTSPMAAPQQETEQIGVVRLPIRVSGMRPGDVLFADKTEVRISAMSGSLLYQGEGACVRGTNSLLGIDCRHDGLEIWAMPSMSSDTSSEQRLYLPVSVYERIKDQPVRVALTYDFTQFVRQPAPEIAAADGVRRLADIGSCATRINEGGDQIEIGCLTNLGMPSCVAGVLEDPQTHTRNPELHECLPDYAPFRRNNLPFDDAVARLKLLIPFRDPSGLAHYPVGSAMIERARVLLTSFQPVDHFHRVLAIPDIRLVDWAQAENTDANLMP